MPRWEGGAPASQQVLELIREGVTTRGEVARRTGKNPRTVASLLLRLRRDGTIRVTRGKGYRLAQAQDYLESGCRSH